MRMAALAVAVFALASCGPGTQPLTPEQSAQLKPADARLAGLYEGSCKACHTVADSQAPLTGDRTKWDLRWAQGEDVLVAHVIQGKGQMPAGGQCFTCTPADYRALVRFMTGRDK
jgi:cytochrome c5